MSLCIVRKSDRAVIMNEGRVADSFLMRLRGLIGKKTLTAGEGLLFPRCNQIHMWMMSIPIDVVFLKTVTPKREWTVVAVHSGLQPWKWLPVGSFRADDTLELPSGTVLKMGLKPGEVVCIAS